MSFSLLKLPAALVFLLGLMSMLGWLIAPEDLHNFNPNSILMVFNTSLCFFLCSSVLLLPERWARARKYAYVCIGLFVFIFAGMIFAQDITGINSGIDEFFVKVGINDLNPHPGRMAPQTSLCFILCGLSLLLFGYLNKKWINILIQCALLIVLAFGMIGLAGAWLRLELLYPWYKYSRMAVPTAIGFVLQAIALWIAWYKNAQKGDYLKQEEKRIGATGAAIIIGVVFATGMSVFSVLSNQLEHTLEASLTEAYHTQSRLMENEINLGIEGALPITTRILMNQYLPMIHSSPKNSEAFILEEAKSFLNHNFSAVVIASDTGEKIVEVGHFTTDPQITIPLQQQKYPTELLWKDGAILRIHLDIAPMGKKIGSAVVERLLPNIAASLFKENSLGETAETRICYGISDTKMSCLPSLRHNSVFINSSRISTEGVFPMHLALQGLRGIRVAHDYMNHQVIAAYGPIGATGLGMVVKIDASEFYGPIREKLQYALLLLFVLATTAIWIQRMQLVPLVAKLVHSEREAHLVGEALEESNSLNNAILFSAAHLIIATDTHGTVLVFNKQAERALGYSAQEIIGKQTPAIWHDPQEVVARAAKLSVEIGEEVQPGFDVFTRKIRDGGSEKLEWTFIRKDGSTFAGELTTSALKDNDMQTVGFLGLIQDITERKEIERIKNEFISTVSHELRTPLTSIRGSLGLLLGGVGGALGDKNKNLVDIAYKNCERLVLLINDILDLEKFEAGQMHFDIKLENMSEIVEQAMALNRAYGEKYNVSFVLKESDIAATAYMDSGRILQVMNNLLSNAAKFSPSGSQVEIAITRNADSVRVSVGDHGTGIPKEFIPRIFQKFAQADGSDSRQKGGTGLGLAIARTIIEHMHGTIGFTTDAKKGTTFFFDLPSIAKTDTAPIAIAHKSQRPRILICEDDHDIAQLLSITLEKEGFDSDMVYSAAMALEFIASGAPYIAMTLDIMLPDKDGMQFLQELREKESTRSLPVIIVSAKAEEVSGKLNGLAMGVVDCLKKPIDSDRLIKAIRNIAPLRTKPEILHVEDDEDTVTVLALALKDIAVLTRAATLQEAKRLMQERAFDLIILDLALPDGSGLEVIKILRQNGSSVPVIIFSANEVSEEISARVAVSLTKSRNSSDHIVSTITTLISKMTQQA